MITSSQLKTCIEKASNHGERWKMVLGYPGYYVSNHGRVASVRSGQFNLLHPTAKNTGYLCVGMMNSTGAYKYPHVHKLVAIAFCHKPEGCDEVNHKDEDKTNNNADNLEWCTRKYNQNHGTIKSRISAANKGKRAKQIVQAETGLVFQSLHEAADCNGLKAPGICRALKTGGTAGGYHWKYLVEERRAGGTQDGR